MFCGLLKRMSNPPQKGGSSSISQPLIYWNLLTERADMNMMMMKKHLVESSRILKTLTISWSYCKMAVTWNWGVRHGQHDIKKRVILLKENKIVPNLYAFAATAAPMWADISRISVKAGYSWFFSRWSGLIWLASASAAIIPMNLKLTLKAGKNNLLKSRNWNMTAHSSNDEWSKSFWDETNGLQDYHRTLEEMQLMKRPLCCYQICCCIRTFRAASIGILKNDGFEEPC